MEKKWTKVNQKRETRTDYQRINQKHRLMDVQVVTLVMNKIWELCHRTQLKP